MTRLASWQDYGTHDESAYPELWRGCVGAWAPCLGPTGLTLYDLSKRRLRGTIENSVASDVWVCSGGRYALRFNRGGNRDRVDVGNVCFFAQDFSVSFWVNKLGTPVSPYENIWGVGRWNTGASAGTNEYMVALNNGSNNFPSFFIEISGTTYTVASATALTLGTWSHVCGVRRGTQIEIYLNGNLTGTATVPSGSITNNNRNFRIADSDISVDLQANAEFDDIRAFDWAITPNPIRILAARRGIAYERRKRRSVFFEAAFFNPAWARNSNVIISPVGAA